MADSKITALTENTAPLTTDLLVLVDDPTGTEVTQKITAGNFLKVVNELTADTAPAQYADYVPTYDASGSAAKKVLLGRLSPPFMEGIVKNGKINVAVASNNLTVSMKTIAGNNAGTTEPIFCTIGGTEREISAALSATRNAGTNWFNIGAAEFGGLAQNLFVYLCWVSGSSTVAIGFSRIPYATTYADFSSTTTNEKYGYFSTTPASSDAVVNIGRFTATLSVAAAYNWSISGTGSVINGTIYETDWLQWKPTFTNLTVGSGTLSGRYRISYKTASYKWVITFAADTSISGAVSHTTPFSRGILSDVRPNGLVRLYDSSTTSSYPGLSYFITATSATIITQNAAGTYLAVAGLSATVPYTWATSDSIATDGYEFEIA